MKNISLLFSIILLVACSSNLPYTDIYDVRKLNAGMNISDVQRILGKPVQITSSDNNLIFKYDFRTLNNAKLLGGRPVKGNNPTVIGERSSFYCKFNNDRLLEWGSCLGCCNSLDWSVNTCLENNN